MMKNFSHGKKYKEQEINHILKRMHKDYAIIRRALIEYDFMNRTNDGTSYWVKNRRSEYVSKKLFYDFVI